VTRESQRFKTFSGFFDWNLLMWYWMRLELAGPQEEHTIRFQDQPRINHTTNQMTKQVTPFRVYVKVLACIRVHMKYFIAQARSYAWKKYEQVLP